MSLKENLDRLKLFHETKKKLRVEARREIRAIEAKRGRKFQEIEKVNFVSAYVFNKMVVDKSSVIDMSKFYE